GDFRPNRGPLCNWCDHQAICPAWGGTPLPYPEGVTIAGSAELVPDRS
ncbi:MAG TPA: RecB family exonuclease, partial [Mycobacteriales bacterium]|nr:RecB family exonuclease [Mycobacteriales bacterium]